MIDDKHIVGEYVLRYLEPGMVLGLGSGSTVKCFLPQLAIWLQVEGRSLTLVSSSEETTNLARSLGLAITALSEVSEIDLVIDGADYVNPQLDGIKGYGAALVREKIISQLAHHIIWIVTGEHKLVDEFQGLWLPVEVVPFGLPLVSKELREAGIEYRVRGSEKPIVTDNHNYLVDLRIQESYQSLVQKLKMMTAVVDHGLFVGMCRTVVHVHAGKIQVIEAENSVVEEK